MRETAGYGSSAESAEVWYEESQAHGLTTKRRSARGARWRNQAQSEENSCGTHVSTPSPENGENHQRRALSLVNLSPCALFSHSKLIEAPQAVMLTAPGIKRLAKHQTIQPSISRKLLAAYVLFSNVFCAFKWNSSKDNFGTNEALKKHLRNKRLSELELVQKVWSEVAPTATQVWRGKASKAFVRSWNARRGNLGRIPRKLYIALRTMCSIWIRSFQRFHLKSRRISFCSRIVVNHNAVLQNEVSIKNI